MPTIEEMRADLMSGNPPQSQGGGLTIEQMRADLMSGEQATQGLGISKDIKNVQHKNISFADRALVKNLGGDPQEQMAYLQSKHPDMQFSQDADGQIITKTNKESKWSRIDPTGFDLQDITDIGGNVVSGIAEAAGTAGGALLGTAAGPAGTLAGGMAGAGASSAAMETLKQGLGKALGMNSFKGEDIAKNAALSAVLTPVLGVGGGAWKKELGEKLASKLGKAGAETSLKRLESGVAGSGLRLAGRIKDKVLPELGSLTSGMKAKILKTSYDRAPKEYLGGKSPYEAVREFGPSDIVDTINKYHSSIVKKSEDPIKKLQGAYTDWGSDKVFNLGDAKSDLEFLSKRQKGVYYSPEEDATKGIFSKIYDNVFSLSGKNKKKAHISGLEVSFQKVQDLKSRLREIATPSGAEKFAQTGKTGSAISESLARDVSDKASILLDNIEKDLGEYSGYETLKRKYAKEIQIKNLMEEVTPTPKKLSQLLFNYDTKSPTRVFDVTNMKTLSDKLGLDYKGMAEFVKAHSAMQELGILPSTGSSYTAGRSLVPAIMGYLGMGGGPAGLAVGTAAAVASGPKGVRFLGDIGSNLGKNVKTSIKKYGLGSKKLQRSVWKAMQDNTQQQIQQPNQN